MRFAAIAPTKPLSSGNYDRVAWFYDALASLVFGSALRRVQQAALLAGLPPGAPRVLVLGGGTGWVLTEILRLRPEARILYLEASEQMLARARQRLQPGSQADQVEFRHGTEQDLKPEERFDVLVTFFVLDCFPLDTLSAALSRLNAARQPDAPWLLADFKLPVYWWQRVLLQAMYLFFRLTTGLRANRLPNLSAALGALGLKAQQVGTFFASTMEAVIFEPAPSPKPGVPMAESI
jgi:tRNA (cmo5U34)-methyltransferase